MSLSSGTAVLVIALAFLPTLLAGQGVTTAAVQGRVLGGDGSPIVGARVQVVNLANGRRWEVASRPDGGFLPEGVAVGSYRVEVRALGFTAAARDGQSGGLGTDAVQVWLRAEVLASLGREEEALRLFAPLGFMWGDAGMLAAKHLRMAEIHDRRGRRDAAVRHYERFREIWRECDPAARQLVQRVERRLAQLL